MLIHTYFSIDLTEVSVRLPCDISSLWSTTEEAIEDLGTFDELQFVGSESKGLSSGGTLRINRIASAQKIIGT